jgi:hypothetical protein
MPQQSFQEGWQNQVERREERWRMLQMRRWERWRNERRNGRVYANENLWKCRIWLLKVFDLKWRRRLIIRRWMSLAIEHLRRCWLWQTNHVSYTIFASWHSPALISNGLLAKICTKIKPCPSGFDWWTSSTISSAWSHTERRWRCS